jgi:PASTA domain
MLLIVLVIVLIGILVIVARSRTGTHAAAGKKSGEKVGWLPMIDVNSTVVRSWLAISLVAGLLMFCALAFAVNDSTLRSTLLGGLIASVGSAIAFYFSSKSAEQAIAAATGSETVPDLTGKNEQDALATLGKTSLKLVVKPGSLTDAAATVNWQFPDAGTSTAAGSQIVVTLADPAAAPVPAPGGGQQ